MLKLNIMEISHEKQTLENFKNSTHSYHEKFEVKSNKIDDKFMKTGYNSKWFEIIAHDESNAVQGMLDSATSEQKSILLNQPFDFSLNIDHDIENVNKAKWQVTFPFHVAVTLCAHSVVEVFLSHGVDVSVCDKNDCNVLHACIITAYHKPEMEDQLCATVEWLLKKLDNNTCIQLLHSENKSGYRPVEFAAQQTCLKLMKTLMENVQNVSKIAMCGTLEYRFYDVTEYEIGSRHDISVIHILPYADKRRLHLPGMGDVLLSSFVSNWIDAKIKSNSIPIIVWFENSVFC